MVNRIADALTPLLDDVERAIASLEQINVQERDALQRFDGELLTELTEQRARYSSLLMETESRLRRWVMEAGLEPEFSLREVIAQFGGADSAVLEARRNQLQQRMVELEQVHQDQRIRLLAAYNVTMHVLQKVGAVEARQTYQPQVAR